MNSVMRSGVLFFLLMGMAVAQGNPLEWTQWELQTIGTGTVSVARKPTLQLSQDRLAGFGGCNSLFGTYALKGNSLEFSSMGSTKMACEPELMQLESAYTRALARVNSYALSPDHQTLTLSGTGDSLRFRFVGQTPAGFVQVGSRVLNVEPQKITCFDDPQKRQCLGLEDLSTPTSWGKFTEPSIVGFAFEPGYRYQIQVAVEQDQRQNLRRLRLTEIVGETWTGPVNLGANQKILFVAPGLVDCTGVARQKCMQVREEGQIPWTLLSSPIEGFTQDPDYRYRLIVQVDKVENPPAQASSLKYKLVRLLEKLPVVR